MATTDTKINSNLRRYILFTLSRADKGKRTTIDKGMIVQRIRTCFQCVTILVAKEEHKGEGYHFHVGVLNTCAKRESAPKKLRMAFPEFEGAQIKVTFHKAWPTVCQYVLKEDPHPLIWGEQSLDAIKELVKAKRDHKGSPDKKSAIIERLKSIKSWYETYEDPQLRPPEDNLVQLHLHVPP